MTQLVGVLVLLIIVTLLDCIMTENTKAYIIIGVVIVIFCGLFAVVIHGQKADCLANGGKWVTGLIGGNYSAFCIPK